MIKKSKLKKVGLDKHKFQGLIVSKIVEEKNSIFVEHFYELLNIDGDYFSDFFIWDYEHCFKNLDFIKDIRMKLLTKIKESDDRFIEHVLDEILSGDKKYIRIITDNFFRKDFEFIISGEIEMGKDSYLADEIKKVEKELYKKLKSELCSIK